MFQGTLKILNLSVFLQQQRYIVAISFLFYLHNGLTLSDFLFFQSIFYFTLLLVDIPAGYLGDLFLRKNMLIFSYLLFILRLILWIFIPNYCTILLGEILFAISKALYKGTSESYIYDYLSFSDSQSLMLNKFGKYNFFMSLGSAISCLLGAIFYKTIGFVKILSIELIFNIIAVILLLCIPSFSQTKVVEQKNASLSHHCWKIWEVLNSTVRNSNINLYIVISALFFGITGVFVWLFQPLMLTFEFPVYVFGVVYFVNHLFRSIGAVAANNVVERFSIERVALAVWFLYAICFVLILSSLFVQNIVFSLTVFLFVCASIGLQFVYNVANISRWQSIGADGTRTTVSTINAMVSSFAAALFLLLFKFIIDFSSLNPAIIVFAVLFLFSIFCIRNFFKK